MADVQREDLEVLHRQRELVEPAEEPVYTPRTTLQRTIAWIALAVVLFGLFGSIYWMMKFVPGA